MVNQYVTYARVSTDKQGASGLGLESQDEIMKRYIDGKGMVIGSYIEIESGKINQRTQLREALRHCSLTNATLIIAKLDRLSRDALFLITLQQSNVTFICCDMPQADKFTVGLMALLAQRERELISERTKAALAVLKSRGVLMGSRAHDKATGLTIHKERTRAAGLAARQEKARKYAAEIIPLITEWSKSGMSRNEIVNKLNESQIKTPRGLIGKWQINQVSRLLIPRTVP